MSKNKKKKQERTLRQHKLPKDYLLAVSDRIHTTAPTLEIINNTLEGVYSLAYSKGYARRMADATLFKDKKTTRLKQEWDTFKDELDDLIHKKSNQQDK
jgi:hypothetical protein